MLRRAVWILALMTLSLPTLWACGDPCQQLSDIICDCGETRFEREACRAEVDTQQQNQPAPSQAQQDTCAAAMETCTCQALKDNRTDRCGFTRDEGVTVEAAE